MADSPVAVDSDSAEAADTSHPAFSAPELPPHDQSYLYYLGVFAAFLGPIPIPEAGRALRHLQRSERESGNSLACEEDSVAAAYPGCRRTWYAEGDVRLPQVLSAVCWWEKMMALPLVPLVLVM